MRSVSTNDIERLTSRLGLDFAHGESADAAKRVNTLAEIYRDLEKVPISGPHSRNRADTFETCPYRPSAVEDPHNAWITKFNLYRADTQGELDGVDIGIKDNMAVRGVELTNGSLAFEGFVPGRHATVVDQLLDAGALIVGKTNMDELAFGPTSETSAFGPTENPRAEGHVAGGSSSGSAAAVAAGEVDVALGSDTGGSVRIPASYCGIVGIKPTYGLLSARGITPLAYSMDHPGILARDVETVSRCLTVLADLPLEKETPSYAPGTETDLSSYTIGIEQRFFDEYVSDEVARTVRSGIDQLESAGADVREIDIPALEYSREAWWGLAPAEFAMEYLMSGSRLWSREPTEPTMAAAMKRVRHASSREFGTNVKEMLALGSHLMETHGGYHYVHAANHRAKLTHEFNTVLDDVDLLASPTTPTTALSIGGFERGVTPPVNWDTHPTDLTGHPSISIPCGDANGLPVGFQLMGEWYDEKTVIGVAAAAEGVFKY